MTSLKTIFALLILSLTVSAPALAKTKLGPNEPKFCDVDTFRATEDLEAAEGLTGLVRNHVYQIGDLTLVGLGVGDSEVGATQALANRYSKFHAVEKNCTWYFNDGSDAAAEAFNHHYITSPIFKSAKVAEKYGTVLANIFANDPVSMVSCAVKHGYVAMGCDGMKHRGPSVFAMLLGYAGCSAKNATKIANKVWGNNWVPTSTREAIADKGRLMGDANPAIRKQLQAVMGVK